MSDARNGLEAAETDGRRRAQLSFWRACTLALITFLLGISLPLVTFGLRAATKDDVNALARSENDRQKAIEDRLDAVQRTLDFVTGELRAKGIDKGAP